MEGGRAIVAHVVAVDLNYYGFEQEASQITAHSIQLAH
jgi:hypothetical protein